MTVGMESLDVMKGLSSFVRVVGIDCLLSQTSVLLFNAMKILK